VGKVQVRTGVGKVQVRTEVTLCSGSHLNAEITPLLQALVETAAL
jgi:hypothetical protein